MPKPKADAADAVFGGEDSTNAALGHDSVETLGGDDAFEGEPVGDELDPSDPALTGIPRDETHDSIDRNTGTLTDDAVAKRAELASDLPPPD